MRPFVGPAVQYRPFAARRALLSGGTGKREAGTA